MTRLILIPLLLLAVFSSPVRAQESTASSCPCTLRGTVVDSVSGAPLRGAFVTSSLASPNATLTDAEGSFHFDGLPRGTVSLSAIKPGFLPPQPFLIHYMNFQVAPGAPPAIIKLTPSAVITGRVVDDRGEPLENFRIELLRRAPGEGDLFVYSRAEYFTNDLGDFRIPDLPAGAYYLDVSPRDFGTYHLSEDGTPLGYGRTYYPGVMDSSSATVLKVSAGHETRASFTVSPKPFVRLSGSVVGSPPGDTFELTLFPTIEASRSGPIHLNALAGSFQTDWIPPGNYTLVAQTPEPQSPTTSDITRSARQSVTATSSRSGIQLVLLPDVNIPVRVHGLPQEYESQNIMIYAHSKGSGTVAQAVSTRSESNVSAASAEMYLLSLAPGRYWLEVPHYIEEPYYVESVTFGSTDLLSNDLIVDSSTASSSIDVVFRQGAATLSGTVAVKDSSHGALVCLFPPSPRSMPLFRYTETDGSFRLDHLSPGAYRIVALDGLTDPDSSNLDLVKKLSALAKEVSLAPQQSLSLTLNVSAVEE